MATTKKKSEPKAVGEPAPEADAVAKPKRNAAVKAKAPADAEVVPVAESAPVEVEAAPAVKSKAAAKPKAPAVAEIAPVEVGSAPAVKSKAAAKPKAVAKSKVTASTETEAIATPIADVLVEAVAESEAEVAAKPKPRATAKKKAPAPVVEAAVVAPAFPATEYAVVEKLLVGFVASEVRKVGVTRAILGLSGGVDSAVSAAIAARALGASNVLGVFMPYSSSSPESEADAREVATSLGIEMLVVDISAQIDAYFAAFPDASRLRRGNKMARERMTILYDHSAARSALVIGTSNKTELLLGYGTLYGDMASALNPIGDLYKTQVWGLARHLALPASVIEKAPTADLWSGQTDENELGFSYHTVDQLLYRLIDERCSTDELVDMGFDAAFVERISRMVRSSQFKRRLPIIAKLSARSIDTDFRYSRDWGL